MTGEHAYHIELNKMFRTQYKETLSVFGGPHPTLHHNKHRTTIPKSFFITI